MSQSETNTRFNNLENDSQRLGWFMSTLASLVEAVELVDEARTGGPGYALAHREEWLKRSTADAKETLEAMQQYTDSFLAVADSAEVK